MNTTSPPAMTAPFDLHSIYDKIQWQNLDVHVGFTDEFCDLYGLNTDPDYQRGHVWTAEQSGRFIHHFFSGGETPRLLITSPHDENFELLDGKQRFHAIRGFWNDQKAMLLPDGQRVYRRDCDPKSVLVVGRRLHIPFGLMRQTRKEAMRLYIKLNSFGTVHSPQEIERVKALLQSEAPKP